MSGPLQRQVQRLAEGGVTSSTLVDAALAEIDRTQPTLHAFLRSHAEAARTAAAAADEARRQGDSRPLLGVPLAVKDSHAVAGSPAPALGSAAATSVSEVDDPWVAALRAAGCVVVGQTTMPPLALLPWGPARNPHDPRRSAGGSSSGSAAAVAAGIVALATASDGGGSIRIPAAMCGLFGFKPAPGWIPGPLHWNGLSTSGILTATPADSALVLDATLGSGWSLAEATDPDPLRIGWTDTPATPLGRPSPAVVTALAEAVVTLQSHGHRVSRVRLKNGDAAPALAARILDGASDDLASLRSAAGGFGLTQPVRLMAAAGSRVPRRGLAWANARGDVIRQRMVGLPFDVLLTPTLPGIAPQQDDSRLARPAAVIEALRWSSWTGVWNVAGLPAVSAPTGTTADGMPLGVQLVDLRGDGRGLFALARLLRQDDGAASD